MDTSMNSLINQYIERGNPFAVASVVAVRGSASAKPGSRAVIDDSGKNVMGWMGGGCAESFVCNQAVEAMKERVTRVVTVDLDDEIFGVGMPCGGVMDVFIEPVLPQPALNLAGGTDIRESITAIARIVGCSVQWDGPNSPKINFELRSRFSTQEISILAVGAAFARDRGRALHSLQSVKGVYAEELAPEIPKNFELLIAGHSRITEELARLACLARWPVTVFGPKVLEGDYPSAVRRAVPFDDYRDLPVEKGQVTIIASHHKGDHIAISRALSAGSAYVGLVASAKRSKLVFDYLAGEGVSRSRLASVRAPAGLDIGGEDPAGIALSIACEILCAREKFQAGSILV
ncbi:MAG: XdhC family protein [Bdellovibrionia bacterium]